MTDNKHNHPICRMCENAEHLREQALFAAKAAKTHADRSRKTSSDIASLDIEGIFADLHKMVEIVGGKSNRTQAQSASHTALWHHAAE